MSLRVTANNNVKWNSVSEEIRCDFLFFVHIPNKANTKHYALLIGLNPSAAYETEETPTINRCNSFPMAWDYSGVYIELSTRSHLSH